MDKAELKQALKELFESGEIRIDFEQDDTVHNGRTVKVWATIKIDGEVVSISDFILIPNIV